MFRRFLLATSFLMAPAGEEGSGTNAGDQREGSDGDGAETAVTREWVASEIGRQLNGRIKSFEQKQTKTLNDALAPITQGLTTLTEKLDALGSGGEGEGGGKGKSGDGTNADLSQHPQFKALQRQLDEERKARERRDAELAAERKANREAKLQKTVEEILVREGIDATQSADVAGLLIKVRGVVGYEADDSEAIVFREKDGPIELEAGIKSWVTSVDGKRYTPPRNANGSGDGPRGSGGARPPQQRDNGQPKPASKREIGEAVLRNAAGHTS